MLIYYSRLIPLGEGMDSSAFLVEGKYVFRFPKLPEVTKSLRNEMAIVGQLSGTGIPFVGYRKIDGVPLNEINPLKLPTNGLSNAPGSTYLLSSNFD